MFDPGETAVDAEPEPQILHRLLATTNKGEHLCARQFQSHRAAGFPGSQHRPEHPRPPKLPLAAEAAAQKREMTRMSDAGIWKACAIMARVPKMAWVEVCTTALPPSHQHTTACGSMG